MKFIEMEIPVKCFLPPIKDTGGFIPDPKPGETYKARGILLPPVFPEQSTVREKYLSTGDYLVTEACEEMGTTEFLQVPDNACEINYDFPKLERIKKK